MEYYKQLYIGKDVTDYYVKSRPILPEKFFDCIYEFCGKKTSSGHELAVDVGCGPGLSSVPLTKRYAKVIGADVSPSQVANAPTDVPGLSFHVASADNLSFVQSGTVDLVTAGVALHWFQVDRFYKELDRVLKPGGSFAAYCYSMPLPEDNIQLKDYISHIIDEVLLDYWTDGVRIVFDDHYRSLSIPYQDSKRIDDKIELQWTLDQMLGFLGSMGLMGRYLKAHPSSRLMEDICQRFCEICHVDRDAMKKTTLKISAPLFIIMSRKPGKTELSSRSDNLTTNDDLSQMSQQNV